MKEKFYITTAIVYTSQKPHIGNIYEIILTDAIARYKRLRGFDVFFLTGTDEHGQKIQNSAKEKNMTPKQYVDAVSDDIKSIWKLFNISYDKFIRTTDLEHIESVQAIFSKLYEQGDIYKGSYEGFYCTPCESFWSETQLVDGKCPTCGALSIKAKEDAYFLKLSKYQDKLLKYIEENDFIIPVNRKTEMINNFIKPGLQDLCVSRSSFNWGIPVTFEKGHVIYVWIDALSNYITALGYHPEGSSPLFDKYWPADLHVIGKDIVRFHTIFWPIMLLALGIPLPKKVLGHPWLLIGEDKMSKSKGNVIYGEDLVSLFGLDPVRYYLLSEMGFVNDGNLTYESMVRKINSDLVNVVGNLVSRTAAMISQNFDNVVPNADSVAHDEFSLEFWKNAKTATDEYMTNMDKFRVADAVSSILKFAKSCNKYIDETKPWLLAKDPEKKSELAKVLANLVEGIRAIAQSLYPFIPAAAESIAKTFSFSIKAIDFDNIANADYTCGGNIVQKTENLFTRIDEQKFFENLRSFESPKDSATQDTTTQETDKKEPAVIDITEFLKTKLTVGKILECEGIKKSDKLYRIIVDLGDEKRQIVSGIAEHYSPAELLNKNIIVVSNLKPVKLRGVESNGMLLAATTKTPDGKEDVKVIFVDDNIEIGSTLS